MDNNKKGGVLLNKPVLIQKEKVYLLSGIKKLKNLLVIKLKVGVYIYTRKKNKVEILKGILDSYNVQRNRGIVLIEKKDKMRVNLMDNWQDIKLYTRPYRLGVEDQKFLNKKFNKIYSKSKLL